VTRFLARRIAQAIPLLFVISLLAFFLIHAAPGGPLAVYLSNPSVRPEDIERLRHALGLDRPLWSQYWSWLAAFVRGDWGYSFSDGRPVAARIAERLPATLELASAGVLFALVIAIPGGVIAAVRRGRAADHAITAAGNRRHFSAGVLVWAGLQILFAVALGWFPSSGRTDSRRRRLSRSSAAPGSADAGAGLRSGGGLVALPSRLDDRRARTTHR
jgi:peptide/nickel transport system permease protein